MASDIVSTTSLKDPASVVYLFRENGQEVEVKINKQQRGIQQANAVLTAQEIDHIIDNYLRSKYYDQKETRST